MTFPSSWIIGAIVLATDADITADGTPVTISAGTYYLDDASAALSLVEAVLAAVTPEMTTPAIFIARDRKLRITAGASFTWTAIDSRLQAALGIGATVGPTTSATASAISTLLWSPAYCATTVGHPGGTVGWEIPQRAHTASLSGLTQFVTVHGTSQRPNHLRWAQVLQARAWTAGTDDGAPGDFRSFEVEILIPGRRWKWYPDVDESSAVDATPVALPAAKGPYIARDLKNDWWSRSVAHFDGFSDIELKGLLTAEIA